MQVKKVLSIVLTAALVGCVGLNAAAVEYTEADPVKNLIVLRATGHFDIEVPGKTMRKAGTSFSMEYGETVTIKASYSPFSANVDFGLLDSNGTFYYFTETDGSVDRIIKISSKGQYTFAVRNNESYSVSVSGYVNY
jgi:hypothetical protein